MSLPQGNFDKLYDRVIATLNAYSATLASEDQFQVVDDYFRPWAAPESDGRYVFTFMSAVQPEPNRSAARAYYAYRVSFWLEVIVVAEAERNSSTGVFTNSDQVAARQCRRLVEGLMGALYSLENQDLGTTPGEIIAERPMLDVQPYPPELMETERAVVGMRITLSVGTYFEPADISGQDLATVAVTGVGDGVTANVPQS